MVCFIIIIVPPMRLIESKNVRSSGEYQSPAKDVAEGNTGPCLNTHTNMDPVWTNTENIWLHSEVSACDSIFLKFLSKR